MSDIVEKNTRFSKNLYLTYLDDTSNDEDVSGGLLSGMGVDLDVDNHIYEDEVTDFIQDVVTNLCKSTNANIEVTSDDEEGVHSNNYKEVTEEEIFCGIIRSCL